MAAARLGRPDLAVAMLLDDSPRNRFDEQGVNRGGPCPYLPGNGGLLYAVALMCAGWDENLSSADESTSSNASPSATNSATNSATDTEANSAAENAPAPTVHETAPGFPDGWHVRWENLRQAP